MFAAKLHKENGRSYFQGCYYGNSHKTQLEIYMQEKIFDPKLLAKIQKKQK